MQITKVSVSASRKVPHPAEEFASLSALVSFEAEVSTGDDIGACVVALQTQAEDSVERHLRKVAAAIAGRARLEKAAERAKTATDGKADALAAKHGGAF